MECCDLLPRNISWFFHVSDRHRLTNKKSHKNIKCWCLKIYRKSAWCSHNENTTKEQRHNWSIWSTIYMVFGEILTRSVAMFSMICNCANGTAFETIRTQLLQHCFNEIYVGSGNVKTKSRTATPFSQKTLACSTSCFAKRYHSVSFYPTRTTIP